VTSIELLVLSDSSPPRLPIIPGFFQGSYVLAVFTAWDVLFCIALPASRFGGVGGHLFYKAFLD
jgi:hypothetical protein